MAAPTTAKRGQAAKVKSQVEELDRKVEIATEEYNEAQAKFASANAKAGATRKELSALHTRIGGLSRDLGSRATYMYRTGPAEMVDLLLGARDFSDLATTWELLNSLSSQEAQMMADLKATRARAQRARVELERAESAARKQRDISLAKKRGIQRQLASRQSMLAGIESEIAQLEAAERAAEQARASRARERAASLRVASSRSSVKRAPKSGVVGIALRHLGSPYRWAASGPRTFDCSGFTMYVYRQVGVSLPHSSRAQYNSGQRVSRGELKPGDLVFFGRSRIHHVGIYIGGGDFVHSPRTGDVVKVSSLGARSDYAGAVRP